VQTQAAWEMPDSGLRSALLATVSTAIVPRYSDCYQLFTRLNTFKTPQKHLKCVLGPR
jgi:hypothetical protein